VKQPNRVRSADGDPCSRRCRSAWAIAQIVPITRIASIARKLQSLSALGALKVIRDSTASAFRIAYEMGSCMAGSLA
jgi:hypothetical protein